MCARVRAARARSGRPTTRRPKKHSSKQPEGGVQCMRAVSGAPHQGKHPLAQEPLSGARLASHELRKAKQRDGRLPPRVPCCRKVECLLVRVCFTPWRATAHRRAAGPARGIYIWFESTAGGHPMTNIPLTRSVFRRRCAAGSYCAFANGIRRRHHAVRPERRPQSRGDEAIGRAGEQRTAVG